MASSNSKTRSLKIKRREKRMKDGSKRPWAISTSRRAHIVLDDEKFDTVVTKEAKRPLKFDYINYISLPIQEDARSINQTALAKTENEEDPVYRDWGKETDDEEGPWVLQDQAQGVPLSSTTMVMETVLGKENIYDSLLDDYLESPDHHHDRIYDDLKTYNSNQIRARSQCSLNTALESNEELAHQTSASQYEEMVNIFKPLIVENVLVRQVYTYLPFIENPEKFLSIERENPRKAMSELLEYIIRCHEVGKWKQFILALVSCGYQYIVQNIRGYRVIDSSYQKQYIKILSPKIRTMIDVTELLPRLCAMDVLNDHDKEEIEREKCNNGNITAADLLLDRITRKHPLWYVNFISALKEIGRDDIAVDLDIPEMMEIDIKDTSHSNNTEGSTNLQRDQSEYDHKSTSFSPKLQVGRNAYHHCKTAAFHHQTYLPRFPLNHEAESLQFRGTEPDLSQTRMQSTPQTSDRGHAESTSQHGKDIPILSGKEIQDTKPSNYFRYVQKDNLYENVFQYEDAISKHVYKGEHEYQNHKSVVAVHGIKPSGDHTENEYIEDTKNESYIEEDTVGGDIKKTRDQICQTKPYETTQSEELLMQKTPTEMTKEPIHESTFVNEAKTKRDKHSYENKDIEKMTDGEEKGLAKCIFRPRPPIPCPRQSKIHKTEEQDFSKSCNIEVEQFINNDPVSETEYNYDRVNDLAQDKSITYPVRACSKLEERLKNLQIQNNELEMEVMLLKETESLHDKIVSNLHEKRLLSRNISMKEKECQALVSAIDEDEKQAEPMDDFYSSSGITTRFRDRRLESSPSKLTYERPQSSYGDITFNEAYLQDIYSPIKPVMIYDVSGINRNRASRFSDKDSAFYSEYAF